MASGTRCLPYGVSVLLALGACDKGAPPESPRDPATPADPSPPDDPTAAPTSYTCVADEDCAISCEVPNSCCGEGCECTGIYHVKELDRIRADNRARCPRKPNCKVYSCPKSEYDRFARCVDGKCVEAKLASLAGCKTDDDCVLSCKRRAECCDQLCPPCAQAYPKANLAEIEAWPKANCGTAMCPMAKCAKVDYETRAVCSSHGSCEAVRVPPAQ